MPIMAALSWQWWVVRRAGMCVIAGCVGVVVQVGSDTTTYDDLLCVGLLDGLCFFDDHGDECILYAGTEVAGGFEKLSSFSLSRKK